MFFKHVNEKLDINLAILAIVGIAAVILGGMALCLRISSYVRPGILITPSPVSLKLARKKCPIPLPESAFNIQYGVWSYWQSSSSFVRFEAPVSDCMEHVETIFNRYVSIFNLTGVSIIKITNFQKYTHNPAIMVNFDVSWFDIASISNGIKFELEFDQPGRSSPTIYVDQNRGVFYYELLQ